MTTPTPLPLDAAMLELSENVAAHVKQSNTAPGPLYNDCCRWTRDHGAETLEGVKTLAARVAELEADNEERRIAFDDALNTLREQIANANALRDALEDALADLRNYSTMCTADNLEAALAAHPAASLAAHDAEVLEPYLALLRRCQMVVNGKLANDVDNALAAQEVKK